jgi:hypothetical protein
MNSTTVFWWIHISGLNLQPRLLCFLLAWCTWSSSSTYQANHQSIKFLSHLSCHDWVSKISFYFIRPSLSYTWIPCSKFISNELPYALSNRFLCNSWQLASAFILRAHVAIPEIATTNTGSSLKERDLYKFAHILMQGEAQYAAQQW